MPVYPDNLVAREKFGEFVSIFHAHNNNAFAGQFQVISHIDKYLYVVYDVVQQRIMVIS